MAQVPNLRLRIIEGFTGYVLEWIATGRIDVAILHDDAVAAPFEGERLWSEDLFVCARKGGGLDGRQVLPFAELGDLPLIVPGRPHGLRLKIDDVAARVGVKLKVVLEVDGLNAILDLVQSGVGHAILTPSALYGYHGRTPMTLMRLIDPVVSATVVALSPKRRPRTKAVQALLQIIRDEAKAVRSNGRAPHKRSGPLGVAVGTASPALERGRIPARALGQQGCG